jgi:hypothetical protein
MMPGGAIDLEPRGGVIFNDGCRVETTGPMNLHKDSPMASPTQWFHFLLSAVMPGVLARVVGERRRR